MDQLSAVQRQIESQQKQIATINQKLDLILKEMGKVCQYEPEKYSLADAEDEDEAEETPEYSQG